MNITQEELDTLKEAFELYDMDGDGFLNIEQFTDIIMSLGPISNQLTPQQQQEKLGLTDTNKDKKIGFDEFVHVICQFMPHESTTKDDDDETKACFQFFDLNHDGYISQKELDYVINKKFSANLTMNEIKDMMKLADTNHDGYVDFDEFTKLLPPL